MKKLILLCLLPVLSLAQNQIGNDIDGESAQDRSGWSVSLSVDGTVVAIGAPRNIFGSSPGQVKVYQIISGSWNQLGADIDGEAGDGRSGHSVSLSADGTLLAIGAPNNDGNGSNSGQVRIYQNIAGNWIQVGADILGEAAGDLSGWSVSLSEDGTVVAVGSLGSAGNGTNAGVVRVYQNNAGFWTKVGADIIGEAAEDFSGTSVSISEDGTIVAIGAPYNNGNGINAGHVRVYENIAGNWTQIGADIDGEAAFDLSGTSVSLSADGTVVAVGAPYNDGNGSSSGHVRVYQNIAGSWTQVGADIGGEALGNESGHSISLSSDGSIVAIGAPFNNGNGTGSGHVRVYKNNANIWTQVGIDIDGEDANDFSGWSVSLSEDGKVVAIGAPGNDGNGSFSGHVRIFDLTAVLSSDPFVQTNFLIYPNPTSNFVTVELNEGLQLEKVNVYTTSGQLVKTESNSVISLKELATGSYFLEVITNQGKATKTIVVK